MSADNWAECPQCTKNKDVALIRAGKIVESGYGKVSKEDYNKAVSLIASVGIEQEPTLREDYDIGVNMGIYEVDYSASCGVCGFNYSYKYEKIIETD